MIINSLPPCVTDSVLDATRAMVVLGMLAGVAALVLLGLRLFLMKDKFVLKKIAAAVFIAAGKSRENTFFH